MNEVEIQKLFNQFNDLQVLIIGDVMIDSYLWGEVSRISPEAPVPIVDVKKRENRLGGAANVAKNIKALGANPILCSVVGTDNKADILCELLIKRGLTDKGIIKSNGRLTTTKFRVIGNHAQLLRVDEEITTDVSEEDSKALLDKVSKILDSNKIDVIIFEDYDKGLLNARLIEQIIQKAQKKSVPVVVDPKKRNFASYKNATLFKPNLKEIKEGLNIEFEAKDSEALKHAIGKVHETMDIEIVMTTLSEYGICISKPSEDIFEIVPAHMRDITDVSGAGDTVISVASLCLAAGVKAKELTKLANIAGGIVCEKVGVATIKKDIFLREATQLMS